MSDRILVVEDDTETADYLVSRLREAGFAVDLEQDGEKGLARSLQDSYGIVVLDRMLPGLDGLSVLEGIRQHQPATPVIILSAIGSTDERVRGLKAGSDDYLVKPFAISELIARIEALQRRTSVGQARLPNSFTCCDLEVDLVSGKARRAGTPIALQPREFRLLQFLVQNQDHIVTRTMILEQIWGYTFDPGTNVVDVHISNLRKKIDRKGLPPLLHTVRGMGYILGRMS